jgi:hypothetical protein
VRPLLLVDVDGPLNPYAADQNRRPAGYQTFRLLPPGWVSEERRRLEMLGVDARRVKPLRVWLNPSHGQALAELAYDLVWATAWEQDANEFIAPLLGLPELPFIPWSTRLKEGVVNWKTHQIVAWVNGRAFAWIDDEITDADRAWVGENHHGPSFLLRIDPGTGLVSEDFAVLSDWAANFTNSPPIGPSQKT